MYFHIIIIFSPWKRAGHFFWTNLNPLHPRLFVPSLFEFSLVVLAKNFFLILSIYFRYFFIISPWKRVGPFIWTNLNPLHPRCIAPSLVEIGSVVLEKINFTFCQFIFAISLLSSLGKRLGPSFEQIWIPITPRCFVPSMVGSWEDKNVKSLQTDGLTTDNRWSEKLTFKSFQLGELKTHCTGNNIIWRQVTLFLKHNYVICKLTQEFYRR